jgi:nucleoside-diphosphate-sugar epimerase
MLTVAITGASGFIGGRLVAAHLERGDRVRVLTRGRGAALEGTRMFIGDLAVETDTAFVDGADIVYHAAAELRDAARFEKVNIEGTERLLAQACGRVGRWVQLSSVGVYGDGHGGTVDERTPPRPRPGYEWSKLEADRRVERACTRSGTPWSILRPSIVVGPGMTNRSIGSLIRAVMLGRFFHMGSRESIATLVHVDDVVRALIAISNAASGAIANVSSDCPWEDVIARICSRSGRRPPRLRMPRTMAMLVAHAGTVIPGFPLSPSRVRALTSLTRYPSCRLIELTGMRLMRSMPEGLDDAIDACRSGTPSPHPGRGRLSP